MDLSGQIPNLLQFYSKIVVKCNVAYVIVA